MLYATRNIFGSCQLIWQEFAEFSPGRSGLDSGEIHVGFVAVNGVNSADISSTASFMCCKLWIHLYFIFLPI